MLKKHGNKNKVVVITGATSGIGQACALIFGKAGAKIWITGRSRVKLDETLVFLQKEGIVCGGGVCDAAIAEQNQQMADDAIKHFGKIDVLINNAGISMRALFRELDLKVFHQVMDINFWGTVYATKFCMDEIIKNKGAIIGVSSINGFRGTPARTAYTASKFAMNGFFESLRTEVMKLGVHVMVVCPGFTASNIRNNALLGDGTSQSESPREEEKMMTAEEVAEAMLTALRKKKRDLVLTNQGKMAVFLNKWIPGIMDKIVYNHMAKEKDSPFK
ncbi:SDR family oxidoreductase [Cyclobacterium qasimii]|uniref:Short chain dehydrogenase n=1 Tax=Cyclobacterium qasimii M12-11B TaxID=641524 RepID=S7WWV8_9BACT|nr:SDR family oxidoreductase [Cyclobacterium qasimii]EPR68493.1 short chain dehydrogenase [Cyclobacterium qasimii M12-11B]